jgi:hypothetical protein
MVEILDFSDHSKSVAFQNLKEAVDHEIITGE